MITSAQYPKMGTTNAGKIIQIAISCKGPPPAINKNYMFNWRRFITWMIGSHM